jgi:hypothetical protein
MNESPTLDDFERSIAHTLHVKAGQLVVDDEETFDADVSPTVMMVRVSSDATRPGWIRQHRRRLLAMAAAVALLVGGAAILRTGSSNSGSVVASQNVVWYSDVSSMEVPSLLPDGWTIADVFPDNPGPSNGTTWQLFAVDGPSPLSRGVIVSSEPDAGRGLPPGPTLTVRGQDAVTGPSNQPGIPAGAVEVDWAEGDYFHDVVAVGMTLDEVVDFLESLTPRAGGEAGFEAPPGASLDELDTVTDAEQTHSWGGRFTGPEGVGSLTVSAYNVSFGGGLLHRLVGEPHAGGLMIRYDDWDVSLLRPDGWTVDMSTDSSAIGEQPGGIEATLDSLQPADPQELLDMALAQPVRETATVDGWTVEVHGLTEDLGVCLTPPAHEPVCALGQSYRGLTTASALVGGEWVVVALTDGRTPTFETGPLPNAEPDSAADDYETLEGVVDRSDGRVVELVRVPADADAVSVTIWETPNSGFGTGHLRPDS